MNLEIYCLKCRRKTDTVKLHIEETRSGKQILKGKCKVCGSKKNRFIKKGSGWTDLPFELHLPGYNFAGPGTKLEKKIR